MAIALDYAPARLARPRLLGGPGVITLAITAFVMLEMPVRQLVRLAARYLYDSGYGGALWRPLLFYSHELRVNRAELWARVGIALLVLLAFTLWNGHRQRGTRASVAVFVGGVSIIAIGLFCPVPVSWIAARGWYVL